MANRRVGNAGNFSDAYTRRPTTGGGNFNQQSSGNYGNSSYGSGQQNQRQSNNFEDSYSRRKDDYFDSNQNYGGNSGGGRNQQQQGGNVFNSVAGGGADYGRRGDDFTRGGGSNQFQNQQGGVGNARVVRDRDSTQFSGGQGSWQNRSPSPRNRGMGSDNWVSARSQGSGGGYDDSRNMGSGGMRGSNQGMQSLGSSNIGQNDQQQQVVMVVPQGNSGAGGIMGMVPVQATPNPFNVMPRQTPMQVISIPAGFNADAFGQQILAAASARGPNFGQGMMGGGGPQMGIMNQGNVQRQQQQPNLRYDRSVAEGGRGRFSRQSNGNQHNRTPGRATAVRRTELSTSGSNKGVNQARSSAPGRGNNSSAISRGNRKRGVVRDRAAEEVDRKKARPSLPAAKAGNRNDNAKKPSGNNRRNNKKKADAAKKEKEAAEKKAENGEAEVKKEGDEAEVKDGEEKGEATGDDKKDEKKTSKYDEFPTTFLVCKICQKVMNDGPSFESHLSGRAHLALVKILEKRFQKRTELLMFESKIAEEEIGIEMDRQRRAGKSGHGGKNSKSHCKMCDCNYTVNWGTHKVSLGHRVLKEYLHPTCRFCSTNFLRRIDWVNHLFSVAHLRKLTELKSQGDDLEDQESALQDELFAINIEIGKDEHATNVLAIRSTDYRAPTKEDMKELLKDEKGEVVLPEGEIEIPKEYVENQAYGEDAISMVEGACCKVCRTYVVNRSDVDAHVRSKPHYGMYVSYLKKIVKYRENLKIEAEKAAKKAEEEAAAALKKAEEEAAAALKKEKDDAEAAAKKVKEEEAKTDASSSGETPMETDAKVVEESTKTPLEQAETPAATEETQGSVEKPSEDVEMKSADSAADSSATPAVEPSKEEATKPAVESTTTKEASPAKEAPKSPTKPAGGQQARGNSKPARGGNRGGRGGRGGQQGSPRGSATPRGGGNRGNRNSPGGTPNWRGGNRGGPRGGRGGGQFQR